jgi:hypothetical protein
MVQDQSQSIINLLHCYKTIKADLICFDKLAAKVVGKVMDKPKLTGRNLGRFSTLNVDLLVHLTQLDLRQKRPNLKLKTWPRQLLGDLPLAFRLLCRVYV